jgi:N6-L-threonylcarbamoyladenine synthase
VLVLGIESSCDETGAAVVDDTGVVRSDVVHSQVAVHAPYGGIVPELASRDHLRNIGPVVRAALSRAGVELGDVAGIAVTHRPGLVGALLVGVQAAKGLAWASGKPMVGVDHLIGHLLSVYLRRGASARPEGERTQAPDASARPEGEQTQAPDASARPEGERTQAPELADADAPPPDLPYVCLLVSGGHTAVYRVDAPRPDAIHELGATRDDAAGEAFDKVAKLLGLGYPGGPIVDRLAAKGDASRVALSAPMAARTSRDMSFSGIKTQVAQLVARTPPPARADVCAAFQSAVTTVLARKVIEAADREGVRDVVLGGGVAANRELRRRVTELGEARGHRVLIPPLPSCTDNAAMIAYAGAVRLAHGEHDDWDLVATSRTSLERLTRKGRGRR